MFLIDKPFASDFLINTIKKQNYKVVATKEAKELIKDNSLHWISENEAVLEIENDPNISVYTNSENSIAWVFNNIKASKLPEQIQLFKDKYEFRELVKEIYPDFFYKTVALNEIPDLSLDGIKFPFVIKPSLGFFSIGVHIVHNITEWNTAKEELNYDNLKSIYPEEVLNTSLFIIEEYIEGEEYAIDCYFDDKGDVVILNILHHRFSSGTDVSDRVYSTSKDIILTHKNSVEAFLNPLGKKSGLRNFPLHVEIRIDKNGTIKPIEINPLRFGGWCTTADLGWLAYGFNSYEYFINNKKPNWEDIFSTRKNKIYSIVILNNNSGYKTSEIIDFNYISLENDFEKVLLMRKLNIKEYPVFGFVFIETSLNNEEELNNILVSNLKKYISIA